MIRKGKAGSSGARGRRRAIVILPNALTLGTLFFGFWAIIGAVRGDYSLAAWLIFVAGVTDGVDGRIARFTRTGSHFGVELDSLVDLVAFGLAPGLLIHVLLLDSGDWSWALAFIYVAAVAMRLARFNIEQGGRAHLHFHGLPSPMAGVTLAAYYPFSQTAFYTQYLAAWPWTKLIGGGMIVLAGLMLSHVIYPTIPRLSPRRPGGRVAIVVILASVGLLIWNPQLVVFPVGLTYIVYGAATTAALGLLDRLPDRDPLSEELSMEETEERVVEYEDMRPLWTKRSPAGGGQEGSDGDEEDT